MPAGSLSYVASGTAGPVSFTFQVVDNGGTAAGGNNTSSPANTLTINVSSGPHHAPVGAASAVTALEDAAYQFRTTDIQFTDPKIPRRMVPTAWPASLWSRSPSLGSLTNNGSAVDRGQFIPASDMTAGNFKFLGTPNASASPFTSFTFRVKDTGAHGPGRSGYRGCRTSRT